MTHLRTHRQGVAALGFWLLSLFLPPCFLVLRSSLCSSRSTLHLLHPTLRDQLERATYGLSCALLSGRLSLGEASGDEGGPSCVSFASTLCGPLGWWCPSTSGHCSFEGMVPLLVFSHCPLIALGLGEGNSGHYFSPSSGTISGSSPIPTPLSKLLLSK